MSKTRDTVIRSVTEKYLAGLDDKQQPNPTRIERDLINLVMNEFLSIAESSNNRIRFGALQVLSPMQIAQILLTLHHVVQVVPSTGFHDSDGVSYLVGIDTTDANNERALITEKTCFRRLAGAYNYDLTISDFNKIHTALKAEAPRIPVRHWKRGV